MCLLAVNESGVLDQEIFDEAAMINSDGFGAAWLQDGTIHRFKTLKGSRSQHKVYSAIRKRFSGPILLHWRLATQGNIDLKNCHPFRVNKKTVLGHNGMFQLSSKDEGASDTAAFCKILSKLPEDFLQSVTLRDLVRMAVGSSKVAFLSNNGKFDIFGESSGHWKDGTWFSNHSYLPFNATPGLAKLYPPLQRYVTGNFCALCDKFAVEPLIPIDGEGICAECFMLEGTVWSKETRCVTR